MRDQMQVGDGVFYASNADRVSPAAEVCRAGYPDARR
jgi:predicted RNA-binding protein with PUA-like domain